MSAVATNPLFEVENLGLATQTSVRGLLFLFMILFMILLQMGGTQAVKPPGSEGELCRLRLW